MPYEIADRKDIQHMKLVYGTANTAKLNSMRRMLRGAEIDIIGLSELAMTVEPVDESGNNPLENARIKALAYYKAYKKPVFSCDSGLYIEGLEDASQPGVHVRRVQGRTLSDEQMIEHYTAVAASLGGKVKARYQNAICLVLDEDNIFEYDGEDISSEHFMIADKPHHQRTAGFPLDSISIELESGKYYMDIETAEGYKSKYDLGQGFRDFFARVLPKK